MKGVIILSLAALAAVALAEEPLLQYDETKIPELFTQYVKDFNKDYKDEADRKEHYGIFAKAIKVINELNRKHYPQTTFGINQFTDYNEEQRKTMFGYKRPIE